MYDIIGDIHGHADALESLLHNLGYRRRSGAWRFPGASRRVIFLGDFLDRGPAIRRTVQIVRAMIDADSAASVVGNHEYNALIWHTPDGKGGWLRRHTTVHLNQHRATLKQYGIDPDSPAGNRGVLDDTVRGRGARQLRNDLLWMRELPLYLEMETVRVVHAAWENRAAGDALEMARGETLRSGVVPTGTGTPTPTVAPKPTGTPTPTVAPAPLLDDQFLHRSAYGQHRESRTVEILLKGIEIALPEGAWYLDKEGVRRHRTRIRWWLDATAPIRTMADLAMPPADRELGQLPVSSGQREKIPGYTDRRPVFVGHYWFTGTPAPLSPRVACLDYSVARGGLLCSYRFEGDPVLTEEHFSAVDGAGRRVL